MIHGFKARTNRTMWFTDFHNYGTAKGYIVVGAKSLETLSVAS